ncbi:hypothetical protein GOODEAATRI_010966, partial [Goodea atripinnis]
HTRFSVDEVVQACRSLQKIAEQVQDDEETSHCFHDIIIPRLLSLALQAALQSEQRGEGSSGRSSPLLEEVVLSAVVSVISTACSRLQTTLSVFMCVWFPVGLFRVTRFAEQMASRAVSLFLDGDVSFLPDNSFPSHIQLLQVAKALLLRYHPLFSVLTDKVKSLTNALCQCLIKNAQVLKNLTRSVQLFSLLDDTDLGLMAADGFLLLMSDSANVLNRDCHADVRIMYRQRFFSENSAKLVQGFNAAPQGRRLEPCKVDSFT